MKLTASKKEIKFLKATYGISEKKIRQIMGVVSASCMCNVEELISYEFE